MMRSMTGFGRSQTTVAGVDIAIEVNSVNRRNLEISSSLPRDWMELDRELQAEIRGALDRGKVHFQIRTNQDTVDGGFQWNEKAVESSLRRLSALAERLELKWEPDVSSMVSLAALNRVESGMPPVDMAREAVVACFKEAMHGMLEMRVAEGSALADDLRSRLQILRDLRKRIGELSEGSVPHYKAQLMLRLQTAGIELDLSDERLLKEVAIFADKCDISEELTRLGSHFDQIEAAVAAGSPVGRKLEFILQEVGRELNTIGSKSHQAEVSQLVIDAKIEVERIREQLQNIE